MSTLDDLRHIASEILALPHGACEPSVGLGVSNETVSFLRQCGGALRVLVYEPGKLGDITGEWRSIDRAALMIGGVEFWAQSDARPATDVEIASEETTKPAVPSLLEHVATLADDEARVLVARLGRVREAALRYLDNDCADELARNVAMGDEPSVAEVKASIEKRIIEGWWPNWPGPLESGSATRPDRLARALALAWGEP